MNDRVGTGGFGFPVAGSLFTGAWGGFVPAGRFESSAQAEHSKALRAAARVKNPIFLNPALLPGGKHRVQME